LKDGSYEVRGTVRSATNEKKIAPLRTAFGEQFDQLKLVEADLMNAESLKKAIEGCDIVVHTASVFSMD
jgi:nucleoside-diphosphate-sugar epimerase